MEKNLIADPRPFACLPLAPVAITGAMHSDQIAAPDTADVQEMAYRALLARIARGDQVALTEFYDATAARVYALARRIAPESAEETVADVYWQVWQQAQRYDATRGRALAWLLTICRTRALDQRRKREPAENHPAPDSLRPELFREADGPLDILLAVERHSRVHDALSTLNDSARNLLALAFFQDLSHQQIADRTGLPLGTVKSVLRRALLELRATLDGSSISSEELS